ncbi:EXS-domain-containing protein [Piromyces finnis]|uniref:EXS-domain-containing protein n=1 Tax=Piromyces finnis TaxID=1754191 RepID=A0A1Y1V3W5_9FUNG|nr:EXS-domain-containing protein [Piromyces finnis]|eukprot:ORX45357.1 EXS-domain-containing protein [Piromyces finnis]
MKFGQTLLHQSVPEWRKKYIDYKILKKSIKRINISKQRVLNDLENSNVNLKGPAKLIHTSSANILYELPEEIEFKNSLDMQLEKINNFYAEREIEIVNKLVLIVQQIEIYSNNNTEIKKTQYKPIDAFIGVFSHKKKENYSKDLEGSDPSIYNDIKFKSKKAKAKLKNALLELYREMFLLKNYKILNYTGFVKILKKYDKTMKRNYTEIYIDKVDNSHFHTSKILDKVIKQTENIYIKTFRNGNRNAGMDDLRLPDETNNEQHSVIWRAGFCLGLSLPIIFGIISHFVKKSNQIENIEIILQIFGGLSLPIIFLLLFGLNLIVWKKYKINYVFIFEFDSRKHLSPWQFIEISCFLFVLWIYFVFFAVTDYFSGVIEPHLYPVILIFIYICLLFLPFKIFYPQARAWILKIIVRLICAPFYYVRFADFFLGDQFMSISYIFTVIEILICAEYNNYKTMEYKCNSSKSWFISIVTVVPGWIRFLQCLRRYYNTHHANPHLLNAGKYIVGIISILLGTLSRVNGHLYLRIIWILSMLMSTSYSYTWDVKMDWGFFKKNSKNKFLRDDLIFPTWTYYYVMISNLFLRAVWLFTVSPNYWGLIKNGNIVAYASAFIEVLRRFQWNFFRMENEHTNNCGEFRAVNEMPLPYNIKNNNDDDDEFSHDTINNSSNLQNFMKKLNISKENNLNDDSGDNNYPRNNNCIDITNVKEFSKNDDNNPRNNKNSKLKRSHSHDLRYNTTKGNESNNVKFWNIKPSDVVKNKVFDFQDPLNSNKTIHTYNIGSEFNKYLSKMNENLTSIDTIISRYDTKQETTPLSIKVENFYNRQNNIMDLYNQKYNTVKSSNSEEGSDKSRGDTIKIDPEESRDITNSKGLTNLFNQPKTISNMKNTEISSSSITSNSESLTIY